MRLACTAVAPVLTAKHQKPTFEVTEVIANSGVHAVFAKTSMRKFALRLVGDNFTGTVAGLVKVLISFCQCVGAINRFPRIRWPSMFIRFSNAALA